MDICYLSPRAVERAALHALLDELVSRHRPDLIIATRDDDVVALAHWARGKDTARTLVGCVAMAKIIRDKWASYAWAMRNGLPFARSAIDADWVQQLLCEVSLPLVSKPRQEFGSHGAFECCFPTSTSARRCRRAIKSSRKRSILRRC